MNKFRSSLLFAAVVLSLFFPAHLLFSAQDDDKTKNVSGVIENTRSTKSISASEAAILISENKDNPDLVILDVRTPREYSEVHIENALNLDVTSESFTEEARKLGKGKTYIVHCRSGKRSAKATALMEVLGFTDIYDIDGGMLAWEKEGLPVTK